MVFMVGLLVFVFLFNFDFDLLTTYCSCIAYVFVSQFCLLMSLIVLGGSL
jgi:hypothetical protein